MEHRPPRQSGSQAARHLLGFSLLVASLACGLLGPAAPLAPTPTRTPGPAITLPPLSPTPAGSSPAPLATPTGSATPQAEATRPIPAEVLEDMRALEAQVTELRGLQPSREVGRTMLSPEALRLRVMEDFLGDYSPQEAQHDTVVLGLLGLLDPEVDLWNLYLELFTEQVAGFYDDEEERMYVVAGSAFGGLERMTYAHEFVHALQDQTYDLDQGLGYNDQACEEDSEGCAALQSLIEGDATLLSEQWLRTYATPQDLREILDFYQVYESPVFETAPRFLQQDFLFPYDSGLAFVRGLFLQGGWAAVDEAYRDPPRSTEHILHPERYPDDAPVLLDPGDTTGLESALGQGWQEIDRDVLGDWTIRLMLEEHLPSEEANAAAEGWGGDLYLAYQQPETGRAALVWIASWDTLRDAHEFAQAFRAYSETRFGVTHALEAGFAAQGPREYTQFERSSEQTLWIIAPDQQMAQILRQTVAFPAPQQ